MDHGGLLISERIDEITSMCDREQPIYEQISSFSIALYVFGYFSCADLLSAEDIDHVAAGSILHEDFKKIEREEMPSNYNICESEDKYLLVIGDPLFPTHFAVVADMQSLQPYFSKLPFFGSGFDSLAELEGEFIGIDGVTDDDISYYKLKTVTPLEKIDSPKKYTSAKIYTIKNDGNYEVLDYQYAAK